MSEGRIAVIGEALIDIVETGDDEPRLARPGGSPYNVAIGLARLGQRTAFVGRLSRDPLGSILRRHAERSGVDLDLTIDASEPSTVALVELSAGIATYQFGVDGTADFAWTDIELAQIPDDVAAVHFGSLASWTPPGDEAVLRRIAMLGERALISYDPNVRPDPQPDADAARSQVERAVALAHIVKTSEEDLAWIHADADVADIARRWLEMGPSVVVVTCGSSGALAFTAAGVIRRPSPEIEVVDTVGAGDAFTSGLLDALARRGLLTLETLSAALTDPLHRVSDADTAAGNGVVGDVLDDAALVAAITCTHAGANPPRRADLESWRQIS